MKDFFYQPASRLLLLLGLFIGLSGFAPRQFSLKNKQLEITIDAQGNLVSLKNLATGHNYATDRPIWRLYFDDLTEKELEVMPEANVASVSQNKSQIRIQYSNLKIKNRTIQIKLNLTVYLEENQVRFGSEIKNDEPHTIVRELQYPLVANTSLPADHQLLTTYWGGQLYPDPKKQVRAFNTTYPPYYGPSQRFLQMDQKYPVGWGSGGLAANCYAFVGKTQGLYFGSHDDTFEDTGHGLRLYSSQKFAFDELEAGFYKYPNCLTGQTWKREANVIAPYSGDWHQTAKLYRQWANTWWQHRPEPQWLKELPGWQRIIMKHQYGEIFFPYPDLGSRVKTVGESVGLNAVLMHGWHNGGHDNDYPNYIADPKQGGTETLKNQIQAFQKDGGAVLLYYSGRLIDKESEYYKTGGGKKVIIRDNTGTEVSDAYRFRGPGTFTGTYNSRTFAVADFRNTDWQEKLRNMADQALQLGAKSIFYDQMGWGEQPHWDLSQEFPVPHIRTIADKSKVLAMLHDYIDARNKNTALGIELLTDVTAMQADYIHSRYGATEVLNPDWEAKNEKPRTTNFIDWFRYTFPEIIMSDRDIRDDTDIERRVNHTVLKGLLNDVEIYRARALIDETPHYQQYLAKVIQLKTKYKALLVAGTYQDTEGFTHNNPEIEARCFVNGKQLAVVVTQSHLGSATTQLQVPGYTFTESAGVGTVKVEPDGIAQNITLGKHGLGVLVFTKK